MHELRAGHGYAAASALTLVSIVAMLLFMRRKRWI